MSIQEILLALVVYTIACTLALCLAKKILP